MFFRILLSITAVMLAYGPGSHFLVHDCHIPHTPVDSGAASYGAFFITDAADECPWITIILNLNLDQICCNTPEFGKAESALPTENSGAVQHQFDNSSHSRSPPAFS